MIRPLAVAGVGLPLVLVLAGCGSSSSGGEGSPAIVSPRAAGADGSGGCTAPPSTAPDQQHYASEPKVTIAPTTYTATIVTNCGTITVAMDGKAAPHTVNSFAFLAAKHYFDGTYFHRSVSSDGLTVLQGGDQTGTGQGGPGYTLPDENLTGAKYPRGTLAMANTGQAHTGGSQFFLVDKDSQLPASYTPFGTITPAGLAVLDKLMAIGDDGSNGTGDGKPNQTIYIDSLTVTKS